MVFVWGTFSHSHPTFIGLFLLHFPVYVGCPFSVPVLSSLTTSPGALCFRTQGSTSTAWATPRFSQLVSAPSPLDAEGRAHRASPLPSVVASAVTLVCTSVCMLPWGRSGGSVSVSRDEEEPRCSCSSAHCSLPCLPQKPSLLRQAGAPASPDLLGDQLSIVLEYDIEYGVV